MMSVAEQGAALLYYRIAGYIYRADFIAPIVPFRQSLVYAATRKSARLKHHYDSQSVALEYIG
jgi:hypothetical protein